MLNNKWKIIKINQNKYYKCYIFQQLLNDCCCECNYILKRVTQLLSLKEQSFMQKIYNIIFKQNVTHKMLNSCNFHLEFLFILNWTSNGETTTERNNNNKKKV